VTVRRSQSRANDNGAYEVSEFELDSGDDLPVSKSKVARQWPMTGEWRPQTPITALTVDLAAPIPTSLEFGTVFEKITKKKVKNLRFSLDLPAAKLCWSNFNAGPRKQIYVDDIKEIRASEHARNYLAEFGRSDDILPRWFTIVYSVPDKKSKGRIVKHMHLVAPDEFTRSQWTSMLWRLMWSRGNLVKGFAENREASLREYWQRSKGRKEETAVLDSSMDFTEVRNTCRSFHIHKTEHDLKKQFNRLDVLRRGTLDYAQYLEFFKQLNPRKEVSQIFHDLTSGSDSTISLNRFLSFLHDTQGVDVLLDRPYWAGIYESFASKSKTNEIEQGELSANRGMSLNSFRRFLTSYANSALAVSRVPPSLHRPLNEYFISSSHNTYLMGRQVGGESSPEGYIHVLKKGCRCVEIDCWDGDNGQPEVTHGRTFSSRVSFVDCVKVINQYAFVASDYPLTISLEVHCNPEQQRTMAQIMKQHLGNHLVLEPLPSYNGELPSPEDLKHRILIKVKEPKVEAPLPPLIRSFSSGPIHRRQRSKSAPDPRAIEPLVKRSATTYFPTLPSTIPVLSAQPAETIYSVTSSFGSRTASASASSTDDTDWDVDEGSLSKKKKAKTSNIVKELGDMGVYTRGIKYSDFKCAESKTYNHIFSFSETTFENKCKTAEGKSLLERHNARCLMRVYPKRGRVNSSNFDPLQFWRHGVQMAATNWQTADFGTQINDAMFAAGVDRTGYVLKPKALRRVKDENGVAAAKDSAKKRVRLAVEIISAQHLVAPADMRPDADMNPYVVLELFSADAEATTFASGQGGLDASARNGTVGVGSPIRKRTKIIEGNGYDPQFNDQIIMTLDTKYPSLVFVRWTVWNAVDGRSAATTSKEPLAVFTAKLSSLQEGYRYLPLTNKNGETIISKLFCHIRKEENTNLRATNDDIPTSTPVEDSSKSGKDFLRRGFNRTPSGRTIKKEG